MSLPNWEKNYNSLQNKVDKVEGKGLSSNDFTNEYKNKIDNMNDLIQLKSITAQFKSLTNAIPFVSKEVADKIVGTKF